MQCVSAHWHTMTSARQMTRHDSISTWDMGYRYDNDMGDDSNDTVILDIDTGCVITLVGLGFPKP